jgi:SRSO17 transposase
MPNVMDAECAARLQQFFGLIGDELDRPDRRASFATYAMGILGDAERKSAEPIAARACADPKAVDAAHQRLLHFISTSKWSDENVRVLAAAHALDAMRAHSPVETWIIDDTGFLKQGKHSVGVQRQYTGSAGKITNCQIGVSLSIATAGDHVPVDFQLYLPSRWTDDEKRREQAHIPKKTVFKTKPQLALGMLKRAVKQRLPRGIVLADAAYGTSVAFRDGVRKLQLNYAVGVDPKTTVWCVEGRGRMSEQSVSLRDLAMEIEADGGFRHSTWREGTKEDLTARFAMRRVVPAFDDPTRPPGEREELWLLIEWRDGEPEPANYFLSSMALRTSRKKLINIVMQRWRTERAYQDLKGELGLDHFEGRSFPGWHHHISVVLCCYAFVVAERVRLFPPSEAWSDQDDADTVAA